MLIFKKIVLLGYFYLMIYKPEFIFIPHSVNFFFGLLGMVCYFANKPLRINIVSKTRCYPKPILRLYVPVIVVCIITVIVNQTTDFYYLSYFLSLFLYFFMAYLGAVGFNKVYGELTPKILIKYFAAIAVIHVIVSLAMFANSSINDLILSLLKKSEIEENALIRTSGFRLQGFGATFFTSGLINGFILIILIAGMLVEKYSLLSRIGLYLSFIMILIIGTMIARTIMVGAAIGLLILIIGLFQQKDQLFKNIAAISISLSIAVILGIYFVTKSNVDFEAISEFGFEFFLKLSEGDTSSHSTDSMVDMYNTMPDNLKTWLLGDALWQEDGHYYKSVDIGYLRNIFYFGIIGLWFLFIYNYKVLKIVICDKGLFPNYSRIVVYALFVYILIINSKGTVDLFYYILPFYFCNLSTDEKERLQLCK